MKKNNRTKDGAHKKCMACKNTEPIRNWAFDPVKGTYACIHCGSSFYDPDILKMIVIDRNMKRTENAVPFEDMLAVFEETAKRIKINISPTVKTYFKLRYYRSLFIEKVIRNGETAFEWPFTIDAVTLRCYGKDKAITVVDTGTRVEYALNGAAKESGEYKPIDSIWREIGGKKISLSAVIAHIAVDYST